MEDFPFLERKPLVGDVLWHANNLGALVIRRREYPVQSLNDFMSTEVEVFWLWREDEGAGTCTTHNGDLSTWSGWRKT